VLVPTVSIIAALVVLNLLPIPGVVLPFISIAAEPVFDLFGFTITNTLLASWLTMLILIVGTWLITRKTETVPGRWQGFLEMVIEGLYGLVEGAAGPKWARRFFPIVMTIFLFVIVSNWLGLTPLFGNWGPLHHAEHGGQAVVWLTDSQTIGLWVKAEEAEAAGHGSHEGDEELYECYLGKFIAVGKVVDAFTKPGLGCGGRIATFGMGLIDIFVGVVETISEFGKILSFSFRLFGNIFAGEVLLAVIAFLFAYIISLPFYGLEIFVGFVQALVFMMLTFMMLTVAFFVVAISSHGEEGH
jgi:F-type H+-transporting ATPase subunit a